MTRPAPLLGAKLLTPELGPRYLRRPRLLARLRAGLSGRATLIAAGPGYGKTSLAAEFLQERGADSVYYRLDETDRDPLVFLRYLVHGIQEHVPEFGGWVDELWAAPADRPVSAAQLTDMFLRDAEESLGGEIVLVLDEIQSLDASPECTGALRRLLAYLPGTLHPILVGRSLPELGLRPQILEGSVSIVEGRDLRFTPEETGALLNDTFGLALVADTIRKAHDRTGGWVTALRLLRQTARLDGTPSEIPEEVFRRTEAEIFDYFTEEVFAAETEEMRRFLLQSSRSAVIDPEICAEVIEGIDVRAALGQLLRRNLFIAPLESRGEYYAFDPLFRDFLARKLRTEVGAAGLRALDARYGRAHARRGDFIRAIDHLMDAGETEAVGDLLATHGRSLLRSGMIAAVKKAGAFASLGGKRSPSLEEILGEACRLEGDYPAAIGHFERALAGGGEDEDPRPGSRSGRASTLQGMAYALLKTGDLARARRASAEAIEIAGPQDPALLARIENTLAILDYRENRNAEALAGWHEALIHARRAEDSHLTRMIAHNLGLPHAVRGDFQRASECFRILTAPDNPRLGPEEGAAYLNLARIATIQGEMDEAAALLGDAAEIARKWRLQALTADVIEAEGTLLREGGDLKGAGERYARARAMFTELGLHSVLDNLAEEEAILASRRGEGERAEQVISALVASRPEHADRSERAGALLALGEILVRNGEPERAVAPLTDAASLFEGVERAYEACLAALWKAVACHLSGRAREAESSATAALRGAARHGYRAAVGRIAAFDPGFRDLLSTLSTASGESLDALPARAAVVSVGSDRADLTIRLLGPVEVFRDADRKIPPSAWKLKRALQIFCFVAASRSRRATKDRIVDSLWGEARLAVIERNFHPTVSFLRRALNYGHNVPKNFILYEGGAYLLNPAYRYDIDVEALEARVGEARAGAAKGDFPAALAGYDAAIALYRGPFLEEEYDEWTEAPRARYQATYLAALREAGVLHAAKGSAETGIALLRKSVEQDPLDESASCRLMAALAALGRRAAVQQEFDRLSRALDRELAARPLPATLKAYREALNRAGPRL